MDDGPSFYDERVRLFKFAKWFCNFSKKNLQSNSSLSFSFKEFILVFNWEQPRWSIDLLAMLWLAVGVQELLE